MILSMKEEKNKNNKRSFLIFAIIALILILVYNAFVIPAVNMAKI